ncbi:hypothetical protein SAMN06296241_0374 [Salinimicrobium sediminis]|uniref:Uncharacterized protein n=1 Tax=Salinimicrobium sediminis TaxID=1343891 RepID=A0A285X0J5_9FLAO|nr:hypothetical protein SAMN06296241_0374 [Salinimicrobium sediminis]
MIFRACVMTVIKPLFALIEFNRVQFLARVRVLFGF